MINISDTYCTDLMQYDILLSNKFSEPSFLNEDDKELLIEYASILFNTWKNHKTLNKAMLGLVNRLYNYRLSHSPNYAINYVYKELPTKLSNKSYEYKEKAFKRDIKSIIDLMGGDTISTEAGSTLKKSLKEAYLNPNAYIYKKHRIPQFKTKIKSYLIRLKLEGKSDQIKHFIEAIK